MTTLTPLHLIGTAEGDYLAGEDGNDLIEGLAGDDFLRAGGGDNVLEGGTGNDQLSGGKGNDMLNGGDGDDVINVDVSSPTTPLRVRVNGGDGNDTINLFLAYTEGSNIELTGGSGSDTFGFLLVNEHVTITDFQAGAGGDLLDLNLIFDQKQWTNVDLFGTGRALELVQRGTDAVLRYDIDGSVAIAQMADIITLKNIDASAMTTANFVGGTNPRGGSVGVKLNGTDAEDSLKGSNLNDVLSGGEGPDHLNGYSGNDRLEGGADSDWLIGGAGDDVLLGGAGNDYFFDDEGYDFVDGGAGTDRVFSRHPIAGYTLWTDSDHSRILSFGPLHEMRFTNVERIAFSDKILALDVAGSAGQVYRLYQAAYGREPDAAGLSYWIGVTDTGTSMATVARHFIASDEFHTLYGLTPGNAELVGGFYQNVLHRAPDAPGLNYWVDLLSQNKLAAAEVLRFFSESPENQEATAKVIGEGFAYMPYTG